jgi:uncharacterized protein
MTVTRAPAPRPSMAKKALKALILAYQAASGGRSPACRFVPSCSEYALEAIDRFGARKGIPLVVRRLARCRPGGPFGLDPVPDGPSSDGGSLDGCSLDGCSSQGLDQDPLIPEGPDLFVPGAPAPAGPAIGQLVAPAHSGAEKRTA